jgi:hypothetical protein
MIMILVYLAELKINHVELLENQHALFVPLGRTPLGKSWKNH